MKIFDQVIAIVMQGPGKLKFNLTPLTWMFIIYPIGLFIFCFIWLVLVITDMLDSLIQMLKKLM